MGICFSGKNQYNISKMTDWYKDYTGTGKAGGIDCIGEK